jgi:hypothetical protein
LWVGVIAQELGERTFGHFPGSDAKYGLSCIFFGLIEAIPRSSWLMHSAAAANAKKRI